MLRSLSQNYPLNIPFCYSSYEVLELFIKKLKQSLLQKRANHPIPFLLARIAKMKHLYLNHINLPKNNLMSLFQSFSSNTIQYETLSPLDIDFQSLQNLLDPLDIMDELIETVQTTQNFAHQAAILNCSLELHIIIYCFSKSILADSCFVSYLNTDCDIDIVAKLNDWHDQICVTWQILLDSYSLPQSLNHDLLVVFKSILDDNIYDQNNILPSLIDLVVNKN